MHGNWIYFENKFRYTSNLLPRNEVFVLSGSLHVIIVFIARLSRSRRIPDTFVWHTRYNHTYGLGGMKVINCHGNTESIRIPFAPLDPSNALIGNALKNAFASIPVLIRADHLALFTYAQHIRITFLFVSSLRWFFTLLSNCLHQLIWIEQNFNKKTNTTES